MKIMKSMEKPKWCKKPEMVGCELLSRVKSFADLECTHCFYYAPNLSGSKDQDIKKMAQDFVNISEAEKILKELFPHGHPKFIDLILEELKLHSDKNHDFAKGGNPLGNFNRVSAIKKLYPKVDWTSPEATAIDFMLKQLDASLWMMNEGIEAKVEGHDKRWMDISVYAKIIPILIKEGTFEARTDS